MTEFTYGTRAQTVTFGAGKLAALPGLLGDLGVRRALLCTSGTYLRNGTADRVASGEGGRDAGPRIAVFAGVKPHVPEQTVDEALRLAGEAAADAIIGLGGGSAIGTAKAVAAASGGALIVAAVPTTYAGSEMTALYGVTRTVGGVGDAAPQVRKVTVTDPQVCPRLVIYDPVLTLDLPPELTAGTGINALAHCVEGVYSRVRTPLTTAAALAGIERMTRALPRCVRAGDLEARTEMLVGAYLAGTTMANARIALHHAICHTLGGTAGVPHGVANAIMLPHVMRFNLEAASDELAGVARAMGRNPSGNEAVEAVAELTRTLGMPQRLREVGVAEEILPELAAVTLKSPAVQVNPRPVVQAEEIEDVLRQAW